MSRRSMSEALLQTRRELLEEDQVSRHNPLSVSGHQKWVSSRLTSDYGPVGPSTASSVIFSSVHPGRPARLKQLERTASLGCGTAALWLDVEESSPKSHGSRPSLEQTAAPEMSPMAETAFLRATRRQLDLGANRLDRDSKQLEANLDACRLLLMPKPARLSKSHSAGSQLSCKAKSPCVSFWVSTLGDLPLQDSPRGENEEGNGGERQPKKAESGFVARRMSILEARTGTPPGNKKWSKVKGAAVMTTVHKQLAAVQHEDEPDFPVFTQTVGDHHDTAEALRQRAQSLQETIASARAAGGDRQPKVILARRCLAVVDRKMRLLENLEGKLCAFEAVHARAGELWEAILRGSSTADDGAISIAAGLRPALKEATHQGNPIEADRSNFARFVARMGLPPGHDLLDRARKTMKKNVQASCRTAASVFARIANATNEGDLEELSLRTMEVIEILLKLSTPPKHKVLEQLKADACVLRARYVLHETKEAVHILDAATECDGPVLAELAVRLRSIVERALAFGLVPEAEEIKEAKTVVLGLRGHSVLQSARHRQSADKRKPDNDVALQSANEIRTECAQAVEFGVSASDSTLAAALYIAGSLHAGKVLRMAELLRKEDEDLDDEETNPIGWGDPGAAARRIEGEIREAVAARVPQEHPLLQEARAIVQSLRDEELLRRRELAARTGTDTPKASMRRASTFIMP